MSTSTTPPSDPLFGEGSPWRKAAASAGLIVEAAEALFEHGLVDDMGGCAACGRQTGCDESCPVRRLRDALDASPGAAPNACVGPRWTVSAYLVRDHHVLLIRHKALAMWLPVGGGIEAGERPAEAVLREVREETGFAITGIEALGYDEHFTGRRIHMNVAHRAEVMTQGDPVSDGSWDEHLWLRIGAEPPQSTPNNVHKILKGLADPSSGAAPVVALERVAAAARRFVDAWNYDAAELHTELIVALHLALDALPKEAAPKEEKP